MESAFNMTDGEYITLGDIPEKLRKYSSNQDKNEFVAEGKGLPEMVGEYEKKIIESTLRNSSSLSEASSILKMTRQAVKYKIEKYDIDFKKLLKE